MPHRLSARYRNDLELLQIRRCTVQDRYQRAISAVCSFINVLIYMNKTLSGRLRELRNKGKVKLGNPKSGRGRLRELFITKFKSVQMGFHKGGPN